MMNSGLAYEHIELLRYGRATRKNITFDDYVFCSEEFKYPQKSNDALIFSCFNSTKGSYKMTDEFCAINTMMNGENSLKYVLTHDGLTCENEEYLEKNQTYPEELTITIRATDNNKFLEKILKLDYTTWLSEFKGLIKELNWERLQYYPEEAYSELSISDRIEVIEGIFGSGIISDGYLWSADKESILASVVKNIKEVDEQRKLLETLLKNNAIINLIKDIDGSEFKSFVFTISDYITKVYGKPNYAELARYNLSQSGAYNKIFRWAETAGPDPSYHSNGSRRTGYFIITYDTDWWFDEEERLMDIAPYEFVGIQIESPIASLNANAGDFVVIPGVLFHWILKQQDRKQAFDDAVLAADLTLTVFTLGTYAGVKTAVKIGTKVTIAMTIDFICQATIISLHPSKNFKDVKFTDVAWAGASTLISNSKYSFIISPIRTAVLETYSRNPSSLNEALLSATETLTTEIIISLMTNNTIGGTKYVRLLEKTFEKGPEVVFKRLVELGVTPDVIVSVSKQFANSTLKQTINNLSDESK